MGGEGTGGTDVLQHRELGTRHAFRHAKLFLVLKLESKKRIRENSLDPMESLITLTCLPVYRF